MCSLVEVLWRLRRRYSIDLRGRGVSQAKNKKVAGGTQSSAFSDTSVDFTGLHDVASRKAVVPKCVRASSPRASGTMPRQVLHLQRRTATLHPQLTTHLHPVLKLKARGAVSKKLKAKGTRNGLFNDPASKSDYRQSSDRTISE
jgi:hypothetical protein